MHIICFLCAYLISGICHAHCIGLLSVPDVYNGDPISHEGILLSDAETTSAGHGSGTTQIELVTKRGKISDNGYGSRVRAGSQLADAVLRQQNVFGHFGPGKRSTYRLPLSVFGFNKRQLADYGYGSRVDAGADLARAKLRRHILFGSSGPGKRSSQGYLPIYRSDFNSFYFPFSDTRLGLLTENKRGLSDYGYGSRVNAGANYAQGQKVHDHVFGDYGPGK